MLSSGQGWLTDDDEYLLVFFLVIFGFLIGSGALDINVLLAVSGLGLIGETYCDNVVPLEAFVFVERWELPLLGSMFSLLRATDTMDD